VDMKTDLSIIIDTLREIKELLQDLNRGKKEVKTGLGIVKDGLQDIKEIKDLPQDINKGKKEEKIQSNRKSKAKRMPLTITELIRVRNNHFALGLKGWSCPHWKGMTPKVRSTNVLEIRNIKGSTKAHLALICVEENAVEGLKIWQQKFKNPSWEDLSKALCRISGAEKAAPFLKSLGA